MIQARFNFRSTGNIQVEDVNVAVEEYFWKNKFESVTSDSYLGMKIYPGGFRILYEPEGML